MSRRAKHFINPIQDSYYDDGSILVDANAMLNTHERNDMTVNAAGLVRVDPQYSKHASLSRASWLTSPNGLPYKLYSFSICKVTLGDTPTWKWITPGGVCFRPRMESGNSVHSTKTR